MKIETLNISFAQIWYFLQVVENGSYSKASRNLNVTQSTISKSIQALENNLNLQLFVRAKKNLLLTECGKYLYENWKNIFHDMEMTIEQSKFFLGGCSRGLRIGTLDSHRSEAYLLDYLEKYREIYPEINICIESCPADEIRKKLQEGLFDVIFTVKYDVMLSALDGFGMKCIKECPLEICMKKNNPLAKKETIYIEDLKECNLIVISPLHVPSYNIMLSDMCVNNGFRPNIIYYTSNANSQIYNLNNANDVFVCDRFHRDYLTDKLVCKPIENTLSGVAMVWNQKNGNKELEDFLSFFQ